MSLRLYLCEGGFFVLMEIAACCGPSLNILTFFALISGKTVNKFLLLPLVVSFEPETTSKKKIILMFKKIIEIFYFLLASFGVLLSTD
jgi:hypothetical protein